jgi:hypothetical protein
VGGARGWVGRAGGFRGEGAERGSSSGWIGGGHAPATPVSTISRMWWSKRRPKTRLWGRFFECVPKAKRDASFFCERNSIGVASSNGCTALCRLRCTPAAAAQTVSGMRAAPGHQGGCVFNAEERTVRLLQHEQVDEDAVDQPGGLLTSHEQSGLRVLVELGLAIPQEAPGSRRLRGL